MLKLRVSYGKIGDDNIGERWLYMQQWAYEGTAKIGATNNDRSPYTWYRQTALGNPDIHWETAKKANFGVDFSFLNGLISGSVDVFNNYRTDILVNGKIEQFLLSLELRRLGQIWVECVLKDMKSL